MLLPAIQHEPRCRPSSSQHCRESSIVWLTVEMFALKKKKRNKKKKKSHCACTLTSSARAVFVKASTLHLLYARDAFGVLPPEQFDGTCSKAVVLKAAVDNSWSPGDRLYDSSFHWKSHVSYQLAFLEHEFAGVRALGGRIHTHTPPPRSLRIARPECSEPPCAPAAETGWTL